MKKNYKTALEKVTLATRKFRAAQIAYRAQEITDAQYLKERADYYKVEQEFDKIAKQGV